MHAGRVRVSVQASHCGVEYTPGIARSQPKLHSFTSFSSTITADDMENTVHDHLASYPKDAIAWQCNICDSAVPVRQKLEHLASPQHRRRAVTHKLGFLAPDLTGQYIYETPDTSEHVAGQVIRNQATVEVADVHDAGGGGEDSDSNSNSDSDSDSDSSSNSEDDDDDKDADEDEDEHEDAEDRDQDEETDSEEDAMHLSRSP